MGRDLEVSLMMAVNLKHRVLVIWLVILALNSILTGTQAGLA